MNVASLELCKELYELSGWWWDTSTRHYVMPAKNKGQGEVRRPAYSLGFLLTKLPPESNISHIGDKWYIAKHYLQGEGFRSIEETADTPEDAACKLAIELFKQGVLS